MKRIKLKQFRIGHDLSQEAMAQNLGISRSKYALIENGNRNGNLDFWKNLQSVFHIPDERMWELMKRKDEHDEENH